jgi:uncharacterized phiE125 gp8 family phage protein
MSHYGVKLVTAPTVEPVSIEEAMQALRVDEPDEADGIDRYIKAAREQVEKDTGLSLITQTLDVLFDHLPWDGDSIVLPVAPVQSVSSFTTYDTDDVATSQTSSLYGTDLISVPPRLYLKSGQCWPTGLRCHVGAVIRVVAGYGNLPAAVPQELKNLILQLVAHKFENREPIVIGTTVNAKVPMTYDPTPFWTGFLS